jgi:uncharacterized protein (TIGR03435 family)
MWIMTHSAADKMTFARKLAVIALALVAIAFPTLTGVLKSNAQTSGTPSKFDVASIRLNKSGDTNGWIGPGPNGGLKSQNNSALQLITFAYNVRDFQVEGGPAWLKSDRFDILATSERLAAAKTLEDWHQNRERVRNLLIERFKLQAHLETRELPAYTVTVDKQGHKLKPSRADEIEKTHLRIGRGTLQATAVPLDMVMEGLSSILGRKVVNETGLTDTYTFNLEWTPDTLATNNSEAVNGSIFTAIQEQLGLKLSSSKRPVEIVVVERLERPTEN